MERKKLALTAKIGSDSLNLLDFDDFALMDEELDRAVPNVPESGQDLHA